ncbi:MAG: peptide MFS transporter [Chlorobi bacterium]|nr:peptide MFS transporter [Chlorobiota bacterium]
MSDKRTHPKALYTLFTTEMWERFSYYGMRAILTLYLIAAVTKYGFGMNDTEAIAIYGIFTSLVYLTPILGGWVADKFLGKRKTVYMGGLIMATGQFLLALSAFGALWGWDLATRFEVFNLGLGTLIVGNGFFKPNISTIVGDFYDDNDPLKDSAFNIFYMGINLGAILGPFIAGTLGEKVFWGWGFFSAGVGMLIGILWMHLHEWTLEDKGLPPGETQPRVLGWKDWSQIFMLSIAVIVVTVAIMYLWKQLPSGLKTHILISAFALGVLGVAYVIIRGLEDTDRWKTIFGAVVAVVLAVVAAFEAGFFEEMTKTKVLILAVGGTVLFFLAILLMLTSKKTGWSRMGVIVTLAVFNIAFWAGFEQAGGTFNLFAKRNTDRVLDPIWAPEFLKAIPLRIYGYAALFFLILFLVALYIKIYKDDEELKARIRPLYKAGLHGTLTFAFLGAWVYFSQGPEIPASWFQNINPFAILVFAPLFSVLWLKLDKWGINPRTPVKFALGLFFGALAFYVMTLAYVKAHTGHLPSLLWPLQAPLNPLKLVPGGESVLVSPMWLVTVYVILTIGELMLSPIGLSMITKLADAKMVSIVMGLWMASFAAGNYMAAGFVKLMEFLKNLGLEVELYPFIMWTEIAVGLILLALSPLLNKAMKGIH